MIPLTSTMLKLIDVVGTCKELQAICIGYKDSNLELYNYYHSFLEWLGSKHKFLQSEGKKIVDLQNEIWEHEKTERTERMQRIEESSSVRPLIEKRDPTVITLNTTYKELIGKVSEFTILGYKFFFCFEVGKVA